MAVRHLQVKACISVVIAALMLAAPAPAWAASQHFQSGQRAEGNDNSPYDIDQDPCLGRSGGGRHRGQEQACPNFAPQGPRNGRGQRNPGSNAFGLQFNSNY
jgi:hypothetical protein